MMFFGEPVFDDPAYTRRRVICFGIRVPHATPIDHRFRGRRPKNRRR
jgi:hypothetical protein